MEHTPQDWKNYEDFAAGIDTNRLPCTEALAGKTFHVAWPEDTLSLEFGADHALTWYSTDNPHSDWYEAIEVAEHTYFIDITFQSKPQEALTLIVNTATRRVLGIRSRVRSQQEAGGEPRVAQDFLVGRIGPESLAVGGLEPAETRDLIGVRTLNVYSPRHTYEHIYLSSTRYCWQCLVGEQRGHGDVDLATSYKIAEGLYVFTFREFIIPVASVFVFNFTAGRSTGKFLGVTGAGAISNQAAGSMIRKISTTHYPSDAQPV